jgi:hypothetical protein
MIFHSLRLESFLWKGNQNLKEIKISISKTLLAFLMKKWNLLCLITASHHEHKKKLPEMHQNYHSQWLFVASLEKELNLFFQVVSIEENRIEIFHSRALKSLVACAFGWWLLSGTIKKWKINILMHRFNVHGFVHSDIVSIYECNDTNKRLFLFR